MMVGASAKENRRRCGAGIFCRQTFDGRFHFHLARVGWQIDQIIQQRRCRYILEKRIHACRPYSRQHTLAVDIARRQISHASSLSQTVREFLIGFGVQQPVKLGGVGNFNFEKPAAALRLGIDQSRGIFEGFVDRRNLAVDGGIYLGRRFHRFDHRCLVALAERRAYLGQLDKHHVAQLFLGIAGDADPGDVALDDNPSMFFGIFDFSHGTFQTFNS